MTIAAPAAASASASADRPAPAPSVGDPAGLRAALSDVDRLGWDSAPGDAVLRYARTEIVRVAVRRAGLRGPAADDAASTGWAAAWKILNKPGLRHEPSPWGLVAAAVRREVVRDQLAAAYRTNSHAAWRLARLHRAAADAAPGPGAEQTGIPDLGADAEWLRGLTVPVAACPLSLDRLSEHGLEPARPQSAEVVGGLGPRLDQVVAALTAAGWPPTVAASGVAWIANAAATAAESCGRPTAELPGWRELAKLTGLPAWRTRRLASLLLGYRDAPGLLARMVHEGDQVLHDPATQRAVRSTVQRWLPSPSAAAGTSAFDRRQADPVAA
jgi:hypothetical protein